MDVSRAATPFQVESSVGKFMWMGPLLNTKIGPLWNGYRMEDVALDLEET